MNRSPKSLLLVSSLALVQTILPTGSADADVCTDVGNRVNVSTCADLSDVVGQVLTPGRPDRSVGNLTPNVQTCLGWDGRWVEADSCT